MRPSKWLVFIRSQLAGFDRSLTMLRICAMRKRRKIDPFSALMEIAQAQQG